MGRESWWKWLKLYNPDLVNLILIRLFPRSQWNPDPELFPWEGHIFVDTRLNVSDRINPEGLFRPHPTDPQGCFYPTYANWKEIEPARPVVQWVESRNRAAKLKWERKYPGERFPSEQYYDEDDYLHAAHRVFQPENERPDEGNMLRNIRRAQAKRRERQHQILELFHRMNLYDYPSGRLGDLTQITKYGADILGVPKEDKYIRDLRSRLHQNRQPPKK